MQLMSTDQWTECRLLTLSAVVKVLIFLFNCFRRFSISSDSLTKAYSSATSAPACRVLLFENPDCAEDKLSQCCTRHSGSERSRLPFFLTCFNRPVQGCPCNCNSNIGLCQSVWQYTLLRTIQGWSVQSLLSMTILVIMAHRLCSRPGIASWVQYAMDTSQQLHQKIQNANDAAAAERFIRRGQAHCLNQLPQTG